VAIKTGRATGGDHVLQATAFAGLGFLQAPRAQARVGLGLQGDECSGVGLAACEPRAELAFGIAQGRPSFSELGVCFSKGFLRLPQGFLRTAEGVLCLAKFVSHID
jgi:hypothetical protein